MNLSLTGIPSTDADGLSLRLAHHKASGERCHGSRGYAAGKFGPGPLLVPRKAHGPDVDGKDWREVNIFPQEKWIMLINETV